MPPHGRQGRLLRRAERALCRSDPGLASMLSIFTRLAAAERMPAQEQLRPRLPWARRAGQAAATGRPVPFRTP